MVKKLLAIYVIIFSLFIGFNYLSPSDTYAIINDCAGGCDTGSSCVTDPSTQDRYCQANKCNPNQNPTTCESGSYCDAKTNTCLPLTLSNTVNGSSTTITSPFGTDFTTAIHHILNSITLLFLFAVGLVMLGLIFFAGFLYMTDAGNEENAKKAKKTITSAIIGLAIIALTGLIIQFLQAIFGINLGL